MIRYGILGPLTVDRDEHEIPSPPRCCDGCSPGCCRAPGSRRARRSSPRSCGRTRYRPTRKTIQVYIWRLRALLAERDAIRHGASGYALSLDAAEVDAARFERLLGAGVAAGRQGDLALADGTLSGALALWRGVPMRI